MGNPTITSWSRLSRGALLMMGTPSWWQGHTVDYRDTRLKKVSSGLRSLVFFLEKNHLVQSALISSVFGGWSSYWNLNRTKTMSLGCAIFIWSFRTICVNFRTQNSSHDFENFSLITFYVWYHNFLSFGPLELSFKSESHQNGVFGICYFYLVFSNQNVYFRTTIVLSQIVRFSKWNLNFNHLYFFKYFIDSQ